MKKIVLELGALTTAVLVSVAADARGQALAEVARKEAARREAVAASGRTYTNSDLTPDFTTPPPPAPAAAAPSNAVAPAAEEKENSRPEAEAGAADDQPDVTPRDQQEPQPEDDKTEAFWRGQAELIRSRLATQNAQIEHLRARLASFAPGTRDGEVRVVEKTLEHSISDLAFLNEEWVRFERRARDRKIPESWIR